MKFQGFVGPSYTLDSVSVDCQRSVNIYPELVESGTGKEGQQWYLKSTPGLKDVFAHGPGPIRAVYSNRPADKPHNPPNRIFFVSGNEFYRASLVGGVWSVHKVDGNFTTNSGAVKIEARNFDNGETDAVTLMMVDGSGNIYIYAKSYDTVTSTGTETFFVQTLEDEMRAGRGLAWIDGYYIYAALGNDRFYVSDYGVTGFDALNWATAEGSPDRIVTLTASNRNLWLFGEKTVEIWANTGNSSFPFERIQGGFIEKGCLAADSVNKADGVVFWLGRDELGQGAIYAAAGFTPQRISTHAVEQAIAKYANPSKATSYTYSSKGHTFYVLNFEEGTWVYDLASKMWHERAFTNAEGQLERHRADCCTFSPELSMHIVGDYQSNKIYVLEDKYYKDSDSPITRLRTFPHMSASLKRLFFRMLQIDMETGVGLDGNVQGSDPQAVLTWSNDGGHTWSSESWASMGKKIGGIGDFKKRVIWRRLGSAYDRVFRLKITDPVPVTLMSAEIEAEVGSS